MKNSRFAETAQYQGYLDTEMPDTEWGFEGDAYQTPVLEFPATDAAWYGQGDFNDIVPNPQLASILYEIYEGLRLPDTTKARKGAQWFWNELQSVQLDVWTQLQTAKLLHWCFKAHVYSEETPLRPTRQDEEECDDPLFWVTYILQEWSRDGFLSWNYHDQLPYWGKVARDEYRRQMKYGNTESASRHEAVSMAVHELIGMSDKIGEAFYTLSNSAGNARIYWAYLAHQVLLMLHGVQKEDAA